MIRVLLVDDQALMRAGFRMILDAEDDVEVVGEAGDGVEAVEQAHQRGPLDTERAGELPLRRRIVVSRQVHQHAPSGLAEAERAQPLVEALAPAPRHLAQQGAEVVEITGRGGGCTGQGDGGRPFSLGS